LADLAVLVHTSTKFWNFAVLQHKLVQHLADCKQFFFHITFIHLLAKVDMQCKHNVSTTWNSIAATYKFLVPYDTPEAAQKRYCYSLSRKWARKHKNKKMN